MHALNYLKLSTSLNFQNFAKIQKNLMHYLHKYARLKYHQNTSFCKFCILNGFWAANIQNLITKGLIPSFKALRIDQNILM